MLTRKINGTAKSKVEYLCLGTGKILNRYHQKANLYLKRPATKETKTEWSGGIYFFISDKIREDYNDTDHPYPFLVETIKPIDCIRCYIASDTIKSEDIYEDSLAIIKDIRGISFKEKKDLTFVEWLGANNFAFIDDLYEPLNRGEKDFSAKEPYSTEIVLPFNIFDRMDLIKILSPQQISHKPLSSSSK